MTQYLLSVWHAPDEEVPGPERMQELFAAVDAFNQRVVADGAWVFGGGLEPPSTARVVRSRAGQVSMTDGPFAEAKEHIGGFWVIEAPDHEAALAWARDAAAACQGPVEVRPFQPE